MDQGVYIVQFNDGCRIGFLEARETEPTVTEWIKLLKTSKVYNRKKSWAEGMKLYEEMISNGSQLSGGPKQVYLNVDFIHLGLKEL